MAPTTPLRVLLMEMMEPEDALVEYGSSLMRTRGLTHEEFSALALLIYAVAAKTVVIEAESLVKTALARIEGEGKTKQ